MSHHILCVIIKKRLILVKVSKEAKIRINTIKCQTSPRTPHGKLTKTRKHYIQESQEGSHFTVGDYKAAMNRQESIINTNMNYKKDPQKKHRLGTVSKKYLNKFYGTNVTFISDLDQTNR